jgi:hypothetical protein
VKNASTVVVSIALAAAFAGAAAGCGSPDTEAAPTVAGPTSGTTAGAPTSAATPTLTATPLPGATPSSTSPAAATPPAPGRPLAAGSGGHSKSGSSSSTGRALCSGHAVVAQLRPGAGSGDRRSATIGLTNASAVSCTLSGFPELQLVAAGNDPVSTLTVRKGQPSTVRLKPGATAWSALSWTTRAAADEPASGRCQPAADRLAVFAPQDHVEMDVTYSGGPVCQHGRIEVGAFRAS